VHGARGSFYLVLVVFAMLLTQSVFARVLAPYPFAPYLGLPFVFALGTGPGVRVLRGAATAFAIGYGYDLFTGNPLGVHTFVFFTIGSYDVHSSLEPGKHVDITFVADKEGTFPFYCTEFCSALHLEMAGYLLVEPS
jgi:hypothetical protein